MTVAALRKAGVEIVNFDLAKFHRDLDALGVRPSDSPAQRLRLTCPFLSRWPSETEDEACERCVPFFPAGEDSWTDSSRSLSAVLRGKRRALA